MYHLSVTHNEKKKKTGNLVPSIFPPTILYSFIPSHFCIPDYPTPLEKGRGVEFSQVPSSKLPSN